MIITTRWSVVIRAAILGIVGVIMYLAAELRYHEQQREAQHLSVLSERRTDVSPLISTNPQQEKEEEATRQQRYSSLRRNLEGPTQTPTISLGPSQTPSKSIQPSHSLTPSGKPSISARPSTTVPSLSPSISSEPTASPSYMPSISSEPTASPSYIPSISSEPTTFPSYIPSISTYPSISNQPSSSPSVSNQPSISPTSSSKPTDMPSSPPSISISPTVSLKPTISPTDMPSRSSYPSHVPSMLPSASVMPSSMPSASSKPNINPSSIPSDNPSSHPTSNPVTASPTLPPTSSPIDSPTTPKPTTANPTTSPTNRPGRELYAWGNLKSFGIDAGDMLTPQRFGINQILVSAGSKYTIILNADGTVLSGGFISSASTYKGHLGLPKDQVVQGVNGGKQILVLPKVEKVYAGVENSPNTGVIHTIFVDIEGRAYSTGANTKGQLCLGDIIKRDEPTAIEFPGIKEGRRIVDVAIGGEHTLLLDDEGNVYGCGSNANGQLGLDIGSPSEVLEPKKLSISSVKSISAGLRHSIFKTTFGLYVTGNNQYGQLCVPSTSSTIFIPQMLNLSPSSIANVTQFETIKESSYILFKNGSVKSCGRNNHGQLGDGSYTNSPSTNVKLNRVVSILGTGSSAESVFFSTDGDGQIFAAGLNNVGQLGIGTKGNKVNIPTLVVFPGSFDLDIISAAADHTAMVGLKGTFSPTSIPSDTPSVSPKPSTKNMPSLSPSKSSHPSISPSDSPTRSSAPTRTAIDRFVWGDPKSFGTSGIDRVKPVSAGGGVVAASAGSEYTLSIRSDGTTWSSGNIPSKARYKGHLGIVVTRVTTGINSAKQISSVSKAGESTTSPAPKFDKVYAGVENVANTGRIHTILVDIRGKAYSTGDNSNGQLCLGDTKLRNIPQEIVIPSGRRIVDVAVGGVHTLLVDDQGSVFGCGSNSDGQLGLGGTTQVLAPTKITSLTRVTTVSAGRSHSLFLSNNGLFVTGSNQFGQLCRAGTLRTPTLLTNFIRGNVRQFEAIKYSSYVLFNDGSVDSCGKNNYGQLGDGTNTNNVETVVKLDRVTRILGTGPSAESAFFYTEGIVFATGLNNAGQLGIGTKGNNVNIPVLVKFQQYTTIVVLSASGDHTVALGKLGDPFPDPELPSSYPSSAPTGDPSESPSSTPTLNPTLSPTLTPTVSPTFAPTLSPSISPTLLPTGLLPTLLPTLSPTLSTLSPTLSPSEEFPTLSPSSLDPTLGPSSLDPTLPPSSLDPTLSPSSLTLRPSSLDPTLSPSLNPTKEDMPPDLPPTLIPMKPTNTDIPTTRSPIESDPPPIITTRPTDSPTWILIMEPSERPSEAPIEGTEIVQPGGTEAPTWLLVMRPTPPSPQPSPTAAAMPTTGKPAHVVYVPIFPSWGKSAKKGSSWVQPKTYKPEYKSSPLPPPFYAAKSAKAYGGKAVSGWYYTPPTYYNWYPATKASKGGKGSKAYYYQAEKLTGKVSSEMMSNSNGGERRVVSASSVVIMSVVSMFCFL